MRQKIKNIFKELVEFIEHDPLGALFLAWMGAFFIGILGYIVLNILYLTVWK